MFRGRRGGRKTGEVSRHDCEVGVGRGRGRIGSLGVFSSFTTMETEGCCKELETFVHDSGKLLAQYY